MKHIKAKYYEIIDKLTNILYENMKDINSMKSAIDIKRFINNKIEILCGRDIEMVYLPSSVNRGEFIMTIYGIEYIPCLSMTDGIVNFYIDDFYLYSIEDLYDFYLSIKNRDGLTDFFFNVNTDQEFLKCIKTFPYTVKKEITQSSFYKKINRANAIDEILS